MTCVTGGLISPPQSCYNSPAFPDTSLSALNLAAFSPSQFVKPRDLHDSTEYSGDEVGQREQCVSSKEEGGCPGRSRRPSLASSLSSLTTSVSPENEKEANKSKKSLSESSEEEEEVVPITVAEKTSSGDMLEEEEEEEEGIPMSVAEKTSSGDMLEEEEEEDHMIVTEKKTSQDLSDEEEEEEEEEEGVSMIVTEKKSLEDTMEDEEGEPMPGIESKNPPQDRLDNKEGNTMNINADLTVQLEDGNAMTIDADSSVQLDARFEPRRSSRNPQMINKPSLDFVAWPKSPKVTKSKGRPTPRMVLLHVSVQIL